MRALTKEDRKRIIARMREQIALLRYRHGESADEVIPALTNIIKSHKQALAVKA